MAQFRRCGAEELASHRSVEEQLADLDDRSHRATARRKRPHQTALHVDFPTGIGIWSATAKTKMTHLGNGGKRFSPKSQRAHVEEIFRIPDFTCRVTGDSQLQVFKGDAATIVGHADEFDTALGHRNINPRGTGVQGVLDEFFHHTGRTFDNLASRDFVDHTLGKTANLRHPNLR